MPLPPSGSSRMVEASQLETAVAATSSTLSPFSGGLAWRKGRKKQSRVPLLRSEYVLIRTLISCCAVALAQHLSQNSRFAQQPPRGWLRAAQHAILGAQHLSPQAILFVGGVFFGLLFFFSMFSNSSYIG